jgi:hypothetical protein
MNWIPILNDPQIHEYLLFSVPGLASLLGCIIGTLMSEPTDREVMDNFYRVTRPLGFWGDMRKSLKPNVQAKIKAENRRDVLATLIAVPWQLNLFMLGIMLMMKQWDNFKILSLTLLLLSIGLYFTWFRYLSKEVKIDSHQE